MSGDAVLLPTEVPPYMSAALGTLWQCGLGEVTERRIRCDGGPGPTATAEGVRWRSERKQLTELLADLVANHPSGCACAHVCAHGDP